VRGGAVLAREGAPDDHLLVSYRQSRPDPLAVLRALCRRIHLRLRGADADDRLHGRLSERRLTMNEPNHLRRIAVLTIVASVIATPLVIFVLGPHLPPGKASSQAAGQVTDNTVLTAVLMPIICLIVVYFGYALVVFRRSGTGIEEGAAIRGNARAQSLWIAGTSAVVLFLAGYGTWALLQNGSG